jgi:hypothetical protein
MRSVGKIEKLRGFSGDEHAFVRVIEMRKSYRPIMEEIFSSLCQR